jgi:hypothetical protein
VIKGMVRKWRRVLSPYAPLWEHEAAALRQNDLSRTGRFPQCAFDKLDKFINQTIVRQEALPEGRWFAEGLTLLMFNEGGTHV